MTRPLTRADLKRLYLPPADDFTEIDVPPMRYFMVDGAGSPDAARFQDAMKWLFAAVHPIKKLGRKRMGKDYVEAPLECLWWADDPCDFVAGNKEKLKWRLLIPAPEWADDALFADAVAEAGARLGEPPATLRLEGYEEGRSVQIMHLGPNAEERATLERLHGEYLPAHGLVPSGPHHEIYLNDPMRTAPAKLRTVLRQPVRPA